jgi:hypothetical protein
VVTLSPADAKRKPEVLKGVTLLLQELRGKSPHERPVLHALQANEPPAVLHWFAPTGATLHLSNPGCCNWQGWTLHSAKSCCSCKERRSRPKHTQVRTAAALQAAAQLWCGCLSWASWRAGFEVPRVYDAYRLIANGDTEDVTDVAALEVLLVRTTADCRQLPGQLLCAAAGMLLADHRCRPAMQ